ncbi:hypothetical protein [Streptomyces qinglanensis]|uniref:Phytase-like domain-containing protein n=1 Tax=Streptomyces qinglanensis TaxID=943816 RepID=A0A1H9UCP5_9ACTN|nr:hypothetical protein [Streptomyces qinglanensis]SES07235.1 hypothetical protein SAMN05421870_10870 [Streptomyces qinglanensis]
MPRRFLTRRLLPAATGLTLLALPVSALDGGTGASAAGAHGQVSASGRGEIRAPREFSGIAWLATRKRATVPGGDEEPREVFLVCHDTRDNDAERDLPRLSLVRTPVDPRGIDVQELDVDFPSVPNDLESIARVPGRDEALLVESNADGDDPDPTIYLARWDRKLNIRIAGSAPWPSTPQPLVNVEATAVATIGGHDYFVYAERAEGSDTTLVNMTRLRISRSGRITFGTEWVSVPFTAAQPPGARPASGMDIDDEGNLYISAAYDPGDLGPFDSAVYRAARIRPGGPLGAELVPMRPQLLARSSGLKVEGVALVDGSFPIFISDDDEDYGGLLRQLRVTTPENRPAG